MTKRSNQPKQAQSAKELPRSNNLTDRYALWLTAALKKKVMRKGAAWARKALQEAQ